MLTHAFFVSHRARIDLAVASVMGHDRARHHAAQPKAQVFFLDDFP